MFVCSTNLGFGMIPGTYYVPDTYVPGISRQKSIRTHVLFLFGKLTKSGIPGWFLNKIGYLFSRDGARLRNLPAVCGIFRVG